MVSSLVLVLAGATVAPVALAFDLSEHLGNLSPWFKAPVPSGMESDLPASCSVSQVMLMQRHGSRFPLASELTFVTNLVAKLSNASTSLANAKSLPEELQFLRSGYKSVLGHDNLTAIGRRELFDSGVQFRLNYPALAPSAFTLLAGGQDRVIESAQWWQQGFFGRYAASTSELDIIPEDSKTISWITPMNTCPLWDYNYGGNKTNDWDAVYIPSITSRLNHAFAKSGAKLTLTDADTHGALYACAYDLAALGPSGTPWCGVFTDKEIENFEYELDVLMQGAFGYGLPGKMGPVLGSLFVNKLIDRFTDKTNASKPVWIEFGHDTTIDMALTALGLAKDTPALSAKKAPSSSRKWRTSNQVPFAARMVWEKFTCSGSSTPQIRLLLNDAPLPLTTCSKMNKKYGSCTLDDFVASNKASRSIKWGDATWNATCGPAQF